MIVVGAKGHAKEICGVLAEQGQTTGIFFYDDVSILESKKLFGVFPILTNEQEARDQLKNDPRFILGIGSPKHRYQLAQKFISLGGVLTSVISPSAHISEFNVQLAEGLNIMTGAVIMPEVRIGKGCLIHVLSSIHHDSSMGEYCELLPGGRVLGNVSIGNHTSIGSGAVILPKIKIGNNVVVGAGAVVTKNLPDGVTVKGVPAK
jgi:sugar O-acyltransferase (sialic acid O-acetyltransferase NeuD family)